MIVAILPGGSRHEFPDPVTVAEVMRNIGTGLTKVALAGRVGDQIVDTGYTIDRDAKLTIITDRDADGINVIRHSTAHLLVYAVKGLYLDAQVTIDLTIESGFYYSFACKRPFTPDDLVVIKKRMGGLTKKGEEVTYEVLSRDDTVKLSQSIGEKYKAEIIALIPENQEIGLHREGNLVDLCRGPYVSLTDKLKIFRLMKAAGAYRHGDHNNETLQRTYSTVWTKREDQGAYLHMLKEVKKRDHRRLGRKPGPFHVDEYSPDTVFWHPKGWTPWWEIEQYIRRVYHGNDYQEMKGSQILDRTLWGKTGHWDEYRENVFTTELEKHEYTLRPVNCPGHILICKQGIKSYRDLPLRFDEFGICHHSKPLGGLHDIMHVRGFTRDDNHIFCTEDIIQAEATAFTMLLQRAYRNFGFTEILYKLSTRPDKHISTEGSWGRTEAALARGSHASGCEFECLSGGGAFYGPRIEYMPKDTLGRQWQCGTIQVDPNLSGRLDAEFVDEGDARHQPTVPHRAVVGSPEYFIGILIEQYAGALPT